MGEQEELEIKNVQTPPDNKQHIGETTVIAKIQAFFNQLLGQMIAYEAEGDGYLFQDMVPNKSLSKTQTSLGSTVELEIHTEQAFSKWKPDFLSLACLRSDPEAKTYVLHKQQHGHIHLYLYHFIVITVHLVFPQILGHLPEHIIKLLVLLHMVIKQVCLVKILMLLRLVFKQVNTLKEPVQLL